jgi:uncharacterized membrane protein (DUF2068 family)
MRVHVRDGWVRLIGVAKLVKAGLLIAMGLVLLGTLRTDLGETLTRWATYVHVDPHNHYFHAAVARLTGLGAHRKELVAAGSFVYAGLFMTEGIGLLRDRRWAEWLTVIATTSFVPLEVYELIREVTAPRAILLVVNVVIAVYLIVKLRQRS